MVKKAIKIPPRPSVTTQLEEGASGIFDVDVDDVSEDLLFQSLPALSLLLLP